MNGKYSGLGDMMLILWLLSAFVFQKAGLIMGSVSPIEHAFSAFAIPDKDTIKSNIVGGDFLLTNPKPGSYQWIIAAILSYQHKLLTNIPVEEGETGNVSEIQLLLK